MVAAERLLAGMPLVPVPFVFSAGGRARPGRR